MPYSRSSFLIACLLALVTSRGATADDSTLSDTGGTTGTAAPAALTTSDFTIYLQKFDHGQWVQMNTTEQQYFFNRARCLCEADTKDWSGYFKIAIQPAANTTDKIRALLNASGVGSGFAALYVGSNNFDCLSTPAVAGANQQACINLLDPTNYSAGIPGGMATFAATKVWTSDPIPVARVFNAGSTPVCNGKFTSTVCDDTAACDIASSNLIIYFWTQTNSGKTADISGMQIAVNAVSQASASTVPVNVGAHGGNEALTVTWEWPGGLSPSGVGSFLGVQVFCVRAADVQVFKDDTYGPSYSTPQNTCKDFAPASTSGIAGLDPKFLCSGLLPSTSQSFRIEGLQNDIWYGVAVASIDRYGNASAVTDLAYGKPIATVDFYTEYREQGGQATGGYCAMTTGKRMPGLLGAGLLVALGALLWRRKRRGPGAGLFIVVLGAGTLVAGQANAQRAYDDDMGIVENQHEGWAGSPREFAIEVRFGLYTPAIDSEFSGDVTKPQAFIFGNKQRPMWQMELDWELFRDFGTLAIGGAIGYYKENAGACTRLTLDNTPGKTVCDRDTGDNTSLRLIPLAALLVYRFDVLAERWKIPLVPYGKVGLNYTFWNITEGNGNTPYAQGGKGAGGTTGWQAAVGLALQLDFIDPGAARGFDADVGVNHTYAFFELDTIQSSGLGKKGALHVGDNTWFAGLMFEF